MARLLAFVTAWEKSQQLVFVAGESSESWTQIIFGTRAAKSPLGSVNGKAKKWWCHLCQWLHPPAGPLECFSLFLCPKIPFLIQPAGRSFTYLHAWWIGMDLHVPEYLLEFIVNNLKSLDLLRKCKIWLSLPLYCWLVIFCMNSDQWHIPIAAGRDKETCCWQK